MSKFLTIATTFLFLFSSSLARTSTSINLSEQDKFLFNEKTMKLSKRFNVPKRTITKKVSPRVRQDDEEDTESLSYQELFSLQFTYDDAQDLLSGFSFELLKDLFLFNAEDCVFWSFDTFSDFINGFLLILEDDEPMKGLLSFAYSFHKAPIAYYSCYLLFEDYTAIVLFYDTIT